MNGTAKKASVREIRRAFGPDALATLRDHEQALRVLAEIMTRSLRGRLRWLLTGR